MKTVARLYKSKIIAVLISALIFISMLVAGGVFGISLLEHDMRTMFAGNTRPISQLNELRAASLDARRTFWRAAVFAHSGDVDASLVRIRADEMRIESAWAAYYPSGVSSKREEELGKEIGSDLSKFHAVLDDAVKKLTAKDYDNAVRWFDQNVALMDHFDQLIGEDINTNANQAAELISDAEDVAKMMFRIAMAFFGLCVTGASGVVIYLLRQKYDSEGESRYKSWLANRMFECSANGCMITNHEGIIEQVNPAFTRMTGYTPVEVLGRQPDIMSSGRQSPEFYHAFWKSLKETGQWEGELWNRRKDGGLYLEWMSVAGVRDQDGRFSHYVAIMSDVTERHRDNERLSRLATHDTLTGLPNRMLLEERIAHAISRAKRTGNKIAVMFGDLDGFKAVNDARGHKVGDDVLKVVAERLKTRVRESDTVARLGGDEFVIVIEDIDDLQRVDAIARSLVASIGQPVKVDGCDAHVTLSIGISVYPDDGVDAEQLLERGDCAMYEVKKSGKDSFRFCADPAPV
ncbi:diguanylate cyclase/phosphodiesterase with PAS/PAC sensor [Paraburkholderia caribensis MBA4]|uniref:Diguanylate cyclase/phosphodiesterase with PAS/PAC sensor n=1 Tax=Paraburkholderia caribensis MBA4 TaxID=1323664 RepID=A0A0P0RJM0_9BURK|nr:diguanylate cyclase [Paraburkholderia caribensis]ALL68958.1 diguanylate cyclase/phosphodiesterase with PAS/PAC sensor [Paraburkholderia caribensis MBA4]